MILTSLLMHGIPSPAIEYLHLPFAVHVPTQALYSRLAILVPFGELLRSSPPGAAVAKETRPIVAVRMMVVNFIFVI